MEDTNRINNINSLTIETRNKIQKSSIKRKLSTDLKYNVLEDIYTIYYGECNLYMYSYINYRKKE